MKLVENSGSHELPQAETCAIDEDEMEEDEFDAVEVKDSKGKKFFKRLKLMAGKVSAVGCYKLVATCCYEGNCG